MTTLRCRCGGRFAVQPGSAGQIVIAPCCRTKVRVPSAAPQQQDASSAGPAKADSSPSMLVKCPCSQKLRVRKQASTVEVNCPKCRKRLRVAGSSPSPQAVAKRTITDDSLFDDSLFAGLPSAQNVGSGFARPRVPQSARSGAASGLAVHDRFQAAAAFPTSYPGAAQPRGRMGATQVRIPRASKKRLPRWGVFEEDFGAPTLFGLAVIMFLVCSAFGIYMFQRGSELNAQAVASESWVPAEGKILDSGYDLRRSRRGMQVATIKMRYEYSVGGNTYTGSNLSFENHSSHSRNVADAILKPYAPGATCTVYHDPQSPANSVLEKGVQSGNQFDMWMGIAAILFGLFILYDCVAGGINAQRFPQPTTA